MQFNLLAKKGIIRELIKFSFMSVFSLLRFFNKKNKQNNRIAIIAFHKLGDTALTIPAIKAAIANHPTNQIKIFTFDGNQAIYELQFDKSIIEVVGRNNFFLDGRIAKSIVRKQLAMFNPSHIIDLTGNIQSATAICTANARFIEGISLEFFKVIYDRFVPIRTAPRLYDIYLDVTSPDLEPQKRVELASYKRSNTDSNTIAIIVKAGWSAKEWDIINFYKLSVLIAKDYKVQFLAENDVIYSEISSLIRDIPNIQVVRTKTIYNLIEELRSVGLLIGNDSGPIHIANVLGVATIALYGPTNPEFILPFGEHHKALVGRVECSPIAGVNYCYLDAGRKCNDYKCMKAISVETVHSEIQKLM